MKHISTRVPLTLIPVFELHKDDFQSLVRQAYGFSVDYDYCSGQPSSIGMGYQVGELGFKTDGTLTRSTDGWRRKVRGVREGRRTGDIRLLLNMLAEDGWIYRGRYIIVSGERHAVKVATGAPFKAKGVKLRIAIS